MAILQTVQTRPNEIIVIMITPYMDNNPDMRRSVLGYDNLIWNCEYEIRGRNKIGLVTHGMNPPEPTYDFYTYENILQLMNFMNPSHFKHMTLE